MDIFYLDPEAVQALRESLSLLSEEIPYMYEGSISFLLEHVQDLYNDLQYEDALIAKAAYLFRGIVKGHPFMGGNKRTALLTTRVFLNYNGLFMSTISGDSYLIGLSIFYDLIDETELREWIKNNIVRGSIT